jgi:di/tricarboxylate transporter
MTEVAAPPLFASFRDGLNAALTLLIVVGTVYSFVREKWTPDLTALLAILALLVTGVLAPMEAFAGFSHPATVSVAAVLVLSAGLQRTGALAWVARRVLAPLGRSEILLTAALMAVIALLSAFVNNTAAVAVFIPAVLETCRRSGARPGRILMPMAHAATFGGMCTLIGTSTNLVAHEYARSQGLAGFGMFELGRVGLPILGVAFLYILAVGRWFLPKERPKEREAPTRSGDYLAEVEVQSGPGWVGQPVAADRLERDFDLRLVGLVRLGARVPLGAPGLRYEAGDRLIVLGALEHVLAFGKHESLEIHRPRASEARDEAHALAEFVVLPGSALTGRTLRQVDFAARYGGIVVALHRPRRPATDLPDRAPIHSGDVLVVEAPPESLRALSEAPGLLALGAPSHPDYRPQKLAVAGLTLAGVVITASLGIFPIVTAATAGCAVLMMTGSLRPQEAYQAIHWDIIFILAGALALGTALQKTGLTTLLAQGLASASVWVGPMAILVGFLVLALVVSELISNSGTVALLGPVAVSCATEMGVNPMALLAAVTLGASASFAMPIGYQTSLMIYGPGGYRFGDYLRMGIPLNVIVLVLAILLVPRFWPLTPP